MFDVVRQFFPLGSFVDIEEIWLVSFVQYWLCSTTEQRLLLQ